MILISDQLIGLKVATTSGHILGKVKDFEFNTETGKITSYIISSSDLVKKITAQNLIINTNQVIEITNELMIVDDSVREVVEVLDESIAA